MPLRIHCKMPLKVHDDFCGVDFWCAICCPYSQSGEFETFQVTRLNPPAPRPPPPLQILMARAPEMFE